MRDCSARNPESPKAACGWRMQPISLAPEAVWQSVSRHLRCPRSGGAPGRPGVCCPPALPAPPPSICLHVSLASSSIITRHWQYQGTLPDHLGGRGSALSYPSSPNLIPHGLLFSKQWTFKIRSGREAREGLTHTHTCFTFRALGFPVASLARILSQGSHPLVLIWT